MSRALLALAGAWGGLVSGAPPAEPQLLSVYPIGGQAGTSYRATIRGRALKGAYGLWFGSGEISGSIVGFEPDADHPATDKDKAPGPRTVQGLEIEFRLPDDAAVGPYAFRVITPHGLSNPLQLYVHATKTVIEQSGAHELPKDAQPIEGHPAAVHGKITAPGEVDYYSFTAHVGEHLRFAAFSSEAMDPAIAIYEPSGSWFDPNRAKRLAFHDEDVAYPDLTTEPSLTYRFEKDGRYLVRVNGFWGYGGADHSYVLLISPAAEEGPEQKVDEADGNSEWEERTWTRSLDPQRMKTLWRRAVPELAPARDGADDKKKRTLATMEEIPVIDADAEPISVPVEPPEIPVPALVMGTIERPGDIDRVRFSVNEGDKLVLEVETPGKTIPLMNPYLRVVDDEGVEAFTNVYSRVNANGNASKQIEPKTAYAFPREGSFTLEIRDITANYGDPEMSYRVLVRPQVPHLGKVRVAEDHINIFAGEAKKLSIVTEQEEGYDGFALLSIEGLPPGLQAAPATEVEPATPPPFSEGKRERFRTESEKATFVFLSSPDAEPTRVPVKATVFTQPVVDGKLGPRIAVKDILVMLLSPEKEPEKELKPSATGGAAGGLEK